MPQVIATSERMVFSVASQRTEGKRYRVDLLSNGGAGMCSCKDWSTRRSPNIKKGEPILTRRTTCVHVRAALYSFVSELLPRMARDHE